MILRKKDITEYYKNRSALAPEQIEHLFCNIDVLNSTDEKFNDGVKLCTYLLMEKVGAQKAWDTLCKLVVLKNPSPDTCKHIGTVLRRAYRDALRTIPSDGIVTRNDVANFIFKPLIEHCILVKRRHAEKFCSILRHATLDRDEAMSRMLFDVSTSVVWRYLTATNAYVRLGAYCVQLNVFPPSTDDSIVVMDYFNRHCDAFLNALKDPCIDVCLQAIEGVCEIVSMYFEMIPEEYADKIFSAFVALADDESAKIRATLYHGLRHFRECAIGVLKFEKLLKRICKKGIDDPSEYVRCNVFRLLNAIKDSKLVIISSSKAQSGNVLLTLEDVLNRLDFEEIEVIEKEISRLLFTNIFERDISNEVRYHMLNKMCRINRNACLDLHRLIYTTQVTDTHGTLSHLSNVLAVCVPMLKMIISERNDESQNEDVEMTDTNGNDSMLSTQASMHGDLNKHIEKLKNVVDCMVVCYASMRYDPDFKANLTEVQIVARYFAELANDIIANFETRNELLDTALSIIALVRNAGIHASKLKKNCTQMLHAGHFNSRCLEIFGLIDMDELLKLLQTGLTQLEGSLLNGKTPSKRKSASQSVEFLNKKVATEALLVLINLPSCNQYIVDKYMHYVTNFIEQLQRICENFMTTLQRNSSVDMQLFFSCWKLWTILLILRYNRHVFVEVNGSQNESKKSNSRVILRAKHRRSSAILSQINDDLTKDPMLAEYEWIKSHVEECPKLSGNADLVENFYQTIELHFQAYKHTKHSVNTVTDYVTKLHKIKKYPRKRSIAKSFQSCLKVGEHALEFAESDIEDPDTMMQVNGK